MTLQFIKRNVNRFVFIHIFLFVSSYCFCQIKDNNEDRIIFANPKVINLGRGENSLQPTSEPKVVNLGGQFNFPDMHLTVPSINSKKDVEGGNLTPEEIWANINPGKTRVPSVVPSPVPVEPDFSYYYVLIFFILYFLIYLFRKSIKKFLIFILAPLFSGKENKKSNIAFDSNKKISVNDKITYLKEIELLYSKGIIDEDEFKSLKSQILS